MPLTNLGKITILIIILFVCIMAPSAYEHVNNEIDRYNDKFYQQGFRDGDNSGFYDGFYKGIEYEKNWTPCEWRYPYSKLFNHEIGMVLCEKSNPSHVMVVDERFNKEYEYTIPEFVYNDCTWNWSFIGGGSAGGSGGYGYYVVDFS